MLTVPDNREGWPFGTCVHQVVTQNGPATQALTDLGAPWIRIDVNWNEVEPQQGVFDWTVLDSLVNTSRANGYLICATLAYTPGWAAGGHVRSGVPDQADYYKTFVSAVVTRYKDQVKHWGIWNEPEQGGGLKGTWEGTAKQFVDLVMKPGFDAIRAADPQARVLGPDSGSYDWLKDFFSQGGGAYLDIITLHVYACCDSTDNVDKVLWRLDCTGSLLPWLDTCLMNAIPGGTKTTKPVWLTETGWKTLAPPWEQNQAKYYPELLDAMLARSSWWKKTIFYELYDAVPCGSTSDDCWGITRPDWSQKPAFAALKSYIVAHQPRAEAGPPIAGTPGLPVTFNGSGSKDPDGSIVSYRWDFNRADGVIEEAQGMIVTHVYPAAGTYEATLVVTDNHGLEDADTVTVTVGNQPSRPTLRATYAAVAPVIDGKIDDWMFKNEVKVTSSSYVPLTSPTGGDADLSTRVFAEWDAQNLYLAAIISDNIVYNTYSGNDLWKGDSWQVAFDADHDRTTVYDSDGDSEVGFGPGSETTRWVGPPGAPAWSPQVASAAISGGWVVEVAIPWGQLPPFKASLGATLGLSFVVNDDDGGGREGFIQWTPGMGQGKDPSTFGDLVLGGGACETEQPCAVVADCATAPATCACPGSMTCNGALRCEWQCFATGDGGPVSDGAVIGPDGAVAREAGPGVDAQRPSGDGGLSLGDGSTRSDNGAAPGGGCSCTTSGTGPGAPWLLLVLVVLSRRRRLHGR
jgi:uncharacterized protein (TIGR03382 family)